MALDWLCDRMSLDSQNQIKYIDTKNQLADMLTKGNFTRDEWNHLLCLFNISHFSSTVCSEAMAKRVQQDPGEERVTVMSRPMMSLIARASSTLSSSASESPGKKSHESQSPWSAKAEKNDRTGQPVVDCHKQFTESSYSARYSRWDDDKSWSSQEWKADKSIGQRHTSPNQVSLMRRPSTLFWKRKNHMIERSNPLCMLKEKQGHSNSSLETTKQNQNCHWDPDHS